MKIFVFPPNMAETLENTAFLYYNLLTKNHKQTGNCRQYVSKSFGKSISGPANRRIQKESAKSPQNCDDYGRLARSECRKIWKIMRLR